MEFPAPGFGIFKNTISGLDQTGNGCAIMHQTNQPFSCEVCGLDPQITPVKRRNIRHKPTGKPEGISCALCDFASVSNLKMIRHMKTSHTNSCLEKDGVDDEASPKEKVLVEDMSVHVVSDDDNTNNSVSDELLVEEISCLECDFLASDEHELEKHLDESHNKTANSNLSEDNNIPPVVKPLPLYKCNLCSFATTTTDSLKVHKKNSHEKDKGVESVYLHSCISCDFKTNDYSELVEHSNINHRPELQENQTPRVPQPQNQNKSSVVCAVCGENVKTEEECKRHNENEHSSRIECEMCAQLFDSSLSLEWHLETEHEVVASLTCQACTNCFNTEGELKTHMMQYHAHPCIRCHEVLPIEIDLNLHTSQVHTDRQEEAPQVLEPLQRPSTPAKGFKCDRCDQLFGSQTLFNRHVCNPLQASPTVYCDQCQFTRTSVKDFVAHLLEAHKHYLGTYKCSFCDFEAMENKTLNEHMNSVHGMLLILNGLAKNQALVGESFDKFREEWLSCQLLTYNREVVRQADIKNIKTDVGVIIEDMIGDRYQYCNGLTFKEEDNFSQKIKKSDIQHILIEKYNGKVFYRSKDCKFIVDNNTNSLNANSESRNHCPECRIFTSTIVDRFGSKNLEDFVVPDNETEQEFSKKRRGRPKGSRKRLRENESDMKEESYENENSIFEGLAELRVGDVEANLGTHQVVETQMENALVKSESKRLLNEENEENDDFAMEDNPSDDDYDVNSSQLPKRGKRKKTLSKKFQENKSEEVTKPGPGRKPKTPSPIFCSEEGCQESFGTVSAFKAHLQGHVGTFVCSEDTCIQRFNSKEDALNHQKKHMGEKPYTCSECKKEYATRQDLKLHFRKHTGKSSFTIKKLI